MKESGRAVGAAVALDAMVSFEAAADLLVLRLRLRPSPADFKYLNETTARPLTQGEQNDVSSVINPVAIVSAATCQQPEITASSAHCRERGWYAAKVKMAFEVWFNVKFLSLLLGFSSLCAVCFEAEVGISPRCTFEGKGTGPEPRQFPIRHLNPLGL
jgi:hypothetical protein